jgi:hypothetical protein
MYGMLAFLPILRAVRIGKILENSTDYSLQNTARQALFLPTSREAKFKAKQVIDAFCWRAGDVLQAVVVFVGVPPPGLRHPSVCATQRGARRDLAGRGVGHLPRTQTAGRPGGGGATGGCLTT